MDCMNDFFHEAPVAQTYHVVESSPLSNKSSFVVGLSFWPLDMVSSLGSFSPDKESEAILSSSENMTPLSIKISLFHNPLDSGRQSYKNVTHRKKKPLKYKKVLASKKIELG